MQPDHIDTGTQVTVDKLKNLINLFSRTKCWISNMTVQFSEFFKVFFPFFKLCSFIRVEEKTMQMDGNVRMRYQKPGYNIIENDDRVRLSVEKNKK